MAVFSEVEVPLLQCTAPVGRELFAQRTKGTALPTTVLQLNSLSLLTKARTIPHSVDAFTR